MIILRTFFKNLIQSALRPTSARALALCLVFLCLNFIAWSYLREPIFTYGIRLKISKSIDDKMRQEIIPEYMGGSAFKELMSVLLAKTNIRTQVELMSHDDAIIISLSSTSFDELLKALLTLEKVLTDGIKAEPLRVALASIAVLEKMTKEASERVSSNPKNVVTAIFSGNQDFGPEMRIAITKAKIRFLDSMISVYGQENISTYITANSFLDYHKEKLKHSNEVLKNYLISRSTSVNSNIPTNENQTAAFTTLSDSIVLSFLRTELEKYETMRLFGTEALKITETKSVIRNDKSLLKIYLKSFVLSVLCALIVIGFVTSLEIRYEYVSRLRISNRFKRFVGKDSVDDWMENEALAVLDPNVIGLRALLAVGIKSDGLVFDHILKFAKKISSQDKKVLLINLSPCSELFLKQLKIDISYKLKNYFEENKSELMNCLYKVDSKNISFLPLSLPLSVEHPRFSMLVAEIRRNFDVVIFMDEVKDDADDVSRAVKLIPFINSTCLFMPNLMSSSDRLPFFKYFSGYNGVRQSLITVNVGGPVAHELGHADVYNLKQVA